MKVAGSVGDLLVGLKSTSSQRLKSMTAGILTFRPSNSSTGVLPSGVSSKPAVGERQMTHSYLDYRFEQIVSIFEPLAL